MTVTGHSASASAATSRRTKVSVSTGYRDTKYATRIRAGALSVGGSGGATENGAGVVQLDDLDGRGRRGLNAELAQRALVEVLLHDLHRAVGVLRVDVDRADLGELLRHRRIFRDRRVDLHVDE